MTREEKELSLKREVAASQGRVFAEQEKKKEKRKKEKLAEHPHSQLPP